MRIPIVLAVAAIAACAGDSPPPTGLCTGLTYDPCNEEHDCDFGLCQNFATEGFQVCSQPCDASNPCPEDVNGAAGECDVTGICKPAAPNECTL